MNLAVHPLMSANCSVWVFGSRARGSHRPFSDLDLLVEPHSPLPAPLMGSIREDLQESSLPIKVDLVLLSEVLPSYLPGILKDRRKLSS